MKSWATIASDGQTEKIVQTSKEQSLLERKVKDQQIHDKEKKPVRSSAAGRGGAGPSRQSGVL